ncbi:MAG: lysophospholipid acyltransferase family protein [Vicingaceae bacterium]
MGSRLLYYFIILPISYLPFWALYFLSDFLRFVLFTLIGYRKKVIHENLRKSFPEKNEEEIEKIKSKFHKHLCDLVIESIKAFSISKETAQKRMIDRNVELVNKYKKQGRQVILVGGHYGNWELFAITIGISLEHHAMALYTPIKNKFFDEKVKRSRSKYGLEMLPIQVIKEKVQSINNELYAIILGSDQSPRKTQKAYWMTFLNQETGVQFGTEKFAKEIDAVVIFANIFRMKRGHYEIEYRLLTETPNETDYGYITKTHTKWLEEIIQDDPAYWLWSHRRWKYKRPTDEKLHG